MYVFGGWSEGHRQTMSDCFGIMVADVSLKGFAARWLEEAERHDPQMLKHPGDDTRQDRETASLAEIEEYKKKLATKDKELAASLAETEDLKNYLAAKDAEIEDLKKKLSTKDKELLQPLMKR